MIWIAVALLLFIIQVGLVLVLEFRNPSKTMAWLLIIFLFPVVGFLLYYFVAREYRQRRMVRRRGKKQKLSLPKGLMDKINIAKRAQEITNKDIAKQKRLFGLLQSIPQSPITSCNTTEIFSNGIDKFNSLMKDLEKAQHHIHMEYYIIHADMIGLEIQKILIRKAKAGVEVRLSYDGLGCYNLSAQYIRDLEEAGVKVGCFFPLRNSFFARNLNYRNHRKIVVIDGRTGYLGGINIGDEYLGRNPRFGFWRDTHIRFEGDAVYFLQQTFLNDWAFVSGEKVDGEHYYPPHQCMGEEQLQIIASGPDAHWDTIQEVYFGSISTATERLCIVTPYFIPDPSIVMALKTAALSGVQVKIILPGMITDHALVKWASFAYIEELMQTGVQFHLYRKGFIHAKILIADETMATVGTANLDMRSFYENFELNAVIFDKKTIQELVDDFNEDLADSDPIRLSEFAKRSKYQRTKEVFARMLSPLL